MRYEFYECDQCGQEIRLQYGVTGANQAQLESGTTGSSAAGGGIEHVNSACSAGRVPWQIEAIKARIKERVEHHRSLSTPKTELEHLIAATELIGLSAFIDGIEARR